MKIKKLKLVLLCSFFVFALVSIFSSNFFISKQVSAFNSAAKSMVVMEAETGKVLLEKDKNTKAPIASTTKVLTAIVVIENVKNLDEVITVAKQSVGVEGSSIYLKHDEQLSVKDLLYGLMLSSGNDTAVALAIHTAGSVEKFAEMMNAKAKEIGAFNSNFTCPHGLDDKNNYSTAYDLGLISCYAIQNPQFKEICSTKNHKIFATNKYQDRFLYNKNKVLRNVEGGIGVKTGFTKKAGRCLVGAAERNGMTIVTVVINCGPMFEETYKMLDDAFMKYSYQTFIKKDFVAGSTAVKNGVKENVDAVTKEDFKELINKGEEVLYTIEYNLNENLKAPIKKDAIIGKAKVLKQGEIIFEANLYAAENIDKIENKSPLEEIIENFN